MISVAPPRCSCAMAPKNRLSGSSPVKEDAMVAAETDPVGMETDGRVRTEDTGDCVVVPDSITSCKIYIILEK